MKLIDRLISFFAAKLAPKIEVPARVHYVVGVAHSEAFTVSSDFARANAQEVAAAASLGLITTLNGHEFGRLWRPTLEGMRVIHFNSDVFQ